MLSNTEPAGVTQRFIRTMVGMIDRLVFGMLAASFDMFYAITDQRLQKLDVIKSLIGRFQLIIGVVFLFIFAVHIVQGILNPDLFTDSSKGTSKVITRCLMALFLLAAMIPLNIPAPGENSFEEAVSNQGLLFGTLAYAQSKIIGENILGKIILGNKAASITDYDATGTGQDLDGDGKIGENEKMSVSSVGNYFATSIAKMFVFPNMVPGATEIDQTDEEGNLMALCADDPAFAGGADEVSIEDPDTMGRYQWYAIETDAPDIFGYITDECTVDESVEDGVLNKLFNSVKSLLSGDFKGIWASWAGQHWQFQYLWPLSTVVGIYLLFVMFSFATEAAIIVFKIIILRILGPVAAISYISPSDNNKVFSSWASNLASAYTYLLIRFASLYFIILMLPAVLSGQIFPSAGIFGYLFIIIALFQFAKQAPKYVKNSLGISDENKTGLFGNLMGGLSNIAGTVTTGLGAVGTMVNSAASSKAADEERKRLGLPGLDGNVVNPDSGLNRAKHLLAGAWGFGQGIYTGSKMMKDDSKSVSDMAEAYTKINELKAARGRSGSTLLGRAREAVTTLGTGKSSLADLETDLAKYNAISSTSKNLGEYIKKKAVSKHGDDSKLFENAGYNFKMTDSMGNTHQMKDLGVSYNDILNARAEARAKGYKTFNVGSAVLNTEGQATDDFIDEAAGKLSKRWGSDQMAKGVKDRDAGFTNYYNSATDNGVSEFIHDPDVAVSGMFKDADDIFDSYKLGKASGASSGEAKAIENSAKYAESKANQFGGPK